jgi:hypothetical protein
MVEARAHASRASETKAAADEATSLAGECPLVNALVSAHEKNTAHMITLMMLRVMLLHARTGASRGA